MENSLLHKRRGRQIDDTVVVRLVGNTRNNKGVGKAMGATTTLRISRRLDNEINKIEN